MLKIFLSKTWLSFLVTPCYPRTDDSILNCSAVDFVLHLIHCTYSTILHLLIGIHIITLQFTVYVHAHMPYRLVNYPFIKDLFAVLAKIILIKKPL